MTQRVDNTAEMEYDIFVAMNANAALVLSANERNALSMTISTKSRDNSAQITMERPNKYNSDSWLGLLAEDGETCVRGDDMTISYCKHTQAYALEARTCGAKVTIAASVLGPMLRDMVAFLVRNGKMA